MPALRVSVPQNSLRRLGLCSQIATATGGQHSSPIVFPEKQKRSKVKAAKRSSDASGLKPAIASADDSGKPRSFEHRIDIREGGLGTGCGDEKSKLLGYEVFSGKLILDKSKTTDKSASSTDAQQPTSSSFDVTNQEAVDAKLTSKALIWGSHMLHLEDVISVSSPTPTQRC